LLKDLDEQAIVELVHQGVSEELQRDEKEFAEKELEEKRVAEEKES
jgi:hypothetical protein